jgi:hypothetical protein
LTATSASRIAAWTGGVAQVGLHGVDLADPAERLQMERQFRPAHRDPDAGSRAWPARAPHAGPENPIRRKP